MPSSKIIESVGSLIKVDEVVTVQHNIVPNTFVLETIEPYPGYHGNVPSGSKPNLIFLVCGEEFPLEHCVRVTSRIRKILPYPLDATPGKLKIYNDNYCSIRIRGLASFEQIPQLQSYYMSEGFKFMKKKNVQAPALIHLRKPYLLEEPRDGIYKDLVEPMMWYFKMPDRLEWHMLQMMTKNIKNNIDDINFDAAFGWIFINGITDVIRMYVNEPDVERITHMQHLYLEEYRKYLTL